MSRRWLRLIASLSALALLAADGPLCLAWQAFRPLARPAVHDQETQEPTCCCCGGKAAKSSPFGQSSEPSVNPTSPNDEDQPAVPGCPGCPVGCLLCGFGPVLCWLPAPAADAGPAPGLDRSVTESALLYPPALPRELFHPPRA